MQSTCGSQERGLSIQIYEVKRGIMPIRFRKSFTLFPGVKVNVSKGGTSFTVGKKGVHLNFSKRGVRQTVGLPGSGISETSYIVKNSDDEKERDVEKEEYPSRESGASPKQYTRRGAKDTHASPWGFFLFALIALFFIYFGANALGLLPQNFLTNILQTLTHWARQARL